MRKRKAIIGFVMAVTMGTYAVMGNATISYGMIQNDNQSYVMKESETSKTNADDEKIASIHSPIVDASTGAVTFSYVYFGSYPQSEVTGQALTEKIINAEYVSDDAVVAGEKYRRLEQDNQYRYFKYEPIKWRVVWKGSDGVAMLRTESIIDCKPYNKDNPLEHGYSTSWVRTTIRCWLNGYEMYKDKGFLQSAFSEIEQYGIVDTLLFEKNHNITKYVEREANDKIILLFKEIMGRCWNQETLIAKDTEYVVASYNIGRFCNEWMIGNAGTGGFCPYVDCNGNIHTKYLTGLKIEREEEKGEESESDTPYYMNYSEEVCGVCPALQLDLSYTDLWMTEEEYISASKDSDYEWFKGNVNKDEKLDLMDAQMVLKYALKIEEYSKVQKICADMDGDGLIALSDAQKILRKALKID